MEKKQLLLHPENPVQCGGRGVSSHVLKEMAKRIGDPSGNVYIMKMKPIRFLWTEDRVLCTRKKVRNKQKDNIVVLGGRIEDCFGICLLICFPQFVNLSK